MSCLKKLEEGQRLPLQGSRLKTPRKRRLQI